MKKRQEEYPRDYIHIRVPRNTATHPKSPDFVAHSITSAYLTDYIVECVKKNKPIKLDFAINQKTEDEVLLVISVPHFLKHKPTQTPSLLETFLTT